MYFRFSYLFFALLINSLSIFIIILSLLMFLNKNKDQFTANSQIYHYATRQQSNFHQPIANRAKYQKGIGYMGVKVFNRLPINIKKEFDNSKKFRHRLTL